ncbi:DNA-binding transcriptional LysR family regulator [Sediminihabitans luteus]|uniref:DNA-binding transcriptional LysR family regulator n=1 Tax=Sediminihabitans luteus TaxID=1138585 RepID=A0A2M9CPG2_9CELL|nr:LysR family transcriptional regulator [Sediminihabitans luteus]PJJ73791.1 DNA-binding transcriptional LysR family regulator [Sediminihabitans luteus]GIJ00627.1 transcriptional regulator [Sediminihabitans luteus]
METRASSRAERTSLAALELLVATDLHGSISAGARALGVSQPTASAGLRRLERALGLDLLARGTRGTHLTETGHATAAWARDVIDASDRFEHSVEALRSAPSARVRLAASLTIAEYLAPRWLASLAAGGDRPDVELVVRNSREVMELVVADDVELGFVESGTVRRGLRSRTFARDELVCVVAAEHPWARRRSVTPAELVAGGLVVRERGSGTRETLERALVATGDRLPAHLPYLGSTAAVKTAVRHGGAVAVLSSLTVADDVTHGTFVRVPVPGLDLVRRLRVVWRDGVELSATARRIVAAAMR